MKAFELFALGGNKGKEHIQLCVWLQFCSECCRLCRVLLGNWNRLIRDWNNTVYSCYSAFPFHRGVGRTLHCCVLSSSPWTLHDARTIYFSGVSPVQPGPPLPAPQVPGTPCSLGLALACCHCCSRDGQRPCWDRLKPPGANAAATSK